MTIGENVSNWDFPATAVGRSKHKSVTLCTNQAPVRSGKRKEERVDMRSAASNRMSQPIGVVPSQTEITHCTCGRALKSLVLKKEKMV